MTKEQLEEALIKEIEEISKEFPFVKDGLTGYERAKVYGRIGGLKSKRGLAKRDSYKRVIANIKRFEYE